MPLPRRDFLRLVGASAASLAALRLPTIAGPFTAADFERLIPADKKLDPAWVKSLFDRGHPTVHRWPESRLIGMPIGGVGAGQVYLGGDGRLWHWDIFNQHLDSGSGGPHYAKPLAPESPIGQGFVLELRSGGKVQTRALDHTGWREIAFRGEYPIGRVDYRDADCPVAVALEAFSPFIPLGTEDSALPATILKYTVRNTGSRPVEIALAGRLQNPVCLHTDQAGAGQLRNRVRRQRDLVGVECTCTPLPTRDRTTKRLDILFDDFEREGWGEWTATGTAFGSGPAQVDKMPEYQGKVGARGARLVNTHASAPASEVTSRDAATGTLTSRDFTIERDFITFLIGGGNHRGKTAVNLVVNGQTVASATGRNDNRMAPQTWDVRAWTGESARFVVVDQELGPWGNVGLDQIVFTDTPEQAVLPLVDQPDFGSMTLAVLAGAGATPSAKTNSTPAGSARQGSPAPHSTWAIAAVPATQPPNDLFRVPEGTTSDDAVGPIGQKLVGAVGQRLRLAPGESGTVTFLLSWHFPNLRLAGLGEHQGRHYGKRFSNALAVADYVAANFDRLARQTRLWHDTWYDSTLPWWFLDRTFLNSSILATSTCFWLGNDRFYAWEGVGCCAGTCTHVWHYAQAVARLFPSLERTAREMNDYGIGFDADTGRIRFRAEHNDHWAVDGQAGVILRTYREHQMSADEAFLRRVWPRTKQALEFLIAKDTGRDGVVDGPQHNTLDADWFGQIAWLSGLYLAALRAGEEMATEMGDSGFARQCHEIFERGRRRIDAELFNGEYYVNRVDPAHLDAINSGTGCHIDQVMGDAWTWQTGLGRVLDEKQVKSALRSLWRYSFTPDVGPYRETNKPGRWYAIAGEGGLLMCTFPHSDWDYHKAAGKGPDWAAGYFNECMTGFEYQVAWHLMAEGLAMESLAITRMIHDRYAAARRNPWNEVECGDHYARAMASYGVYLAACGFEYHGPKGYLHFAPRLNPEHFRCAFAGAEGWGTFAQQSAASRQSAQVQLKFGRLRLRTLGLQTPLGAAPTRVKVTVAGSQVPASLAVSGKEARVTLGEETTLTAGQSIAIELA